MRYVLDVDAFWWPRDGSTVLIGGSPAGVFSLSENGRPVVEAILAGSDPGKHARLIRSLVSRGVIHPLPEGSDVVAPVSLCVVVPVRDREIELDACLGAINASLRVAEQTGRSTQSEIVVVDDGSAHPERVAAVCARHSATVLRREESRGPGSARNLGAGATESQVLCFVDSDVLVDEDWLSVLIAHLAESDLVAPRVACVPVGEVANAPESRPGYRMLSAYERTEFPLDLGGCPGRVSPGSRISYLPSAAWCVRREVFEHAGGFDESLHTGEDVDFVWRLIAAGGVVRYEPTAAVSHPPRSSFRAMLAQRVGYGRSAGSLATRHPGSVNPYVGSPANLVVLASFVARRPSWGCCAMAWEVVQLHRKLQKVPQPWKLALRLVLIGERWSVQQFGTAILRPWFPVLLVLGRLRGPRFTLGTLVLVSRWARFHDRREDQALGLPRFLLLKLCDDLAYSAGVWAGAVETRGWGAVLPRSRHQRSGQRS